MFLAQGVGIVSGFRLALTSNLRVLALFATS